MTAIYFIWKKAADSPEPWWDGSKFVADECKAKVFDTQEEAEAELTLASSHSYVPIGVGVRYIP
jgi:hypothetical protein